MKLGSLVLILALLTVAAVVVEGSIMSGSTLRTRRGIFDDCVNCHVDERPFYYPLVKYFNKFKDMVVKGVGGIVESAKEYTKQLT